MGAALPGYETTFITRIDMGEDASNKLFDRIQKVIKDFGGELVIKENWGKRRLAYPINKETRGDYHHLVYMGKPGVSSEIERALKLQEKVVRFMTLNLAKEFDPGKFTKDRFIFGKSGKPVERSDRGDRPDYRGDRGDRGPRGR